MYTIGVDLGGSHISVALVNEDLEIISRASVPIRQGREQMSIVLDIGGCINQALYAVAVDISECRAIGIGSPGTCDSANGVVVQAYNLGWFDVPICRFLSERFGIPVYLGNDGDCAALGEVLAGAARGSDCACLITLGSGVGCGIVVHGRIYAGHHTLGGELGHMCIAMDGELCSCGQRGCWEAYASGQALVRQAYHAIEKQPDSILQSFDELDAKVIFDAARQGDALASAVVARYCQYVGVGVVNVVNALYPQVILLGGGIAKAGDILLNPVRDYVAEHFFVRKPSLMPRIVRGLLGDDAGVIGAAALCR